MKVRTGLRAGTRPALFPVGLRGIANMAPLVVGPRCTMPVPCGSCWFCKTWEDRRTLLRFTGAPR